MFAGEVVGGAAVDSAELAAATIAGPPARPAAKPSPGPAPGVAPRDGDDAADRTASAAAGPVVPTSAASTNATPANVAISLATARPAACSVIDRRPYRRRQPLPRASVGCCAGVVCRLPVSPQSARSLCSTRLDLIAVTGSNLGHGHGPSCGAGRWPNPPLVPSVSWILVSRRTSSWGGRPGKRTKMEALLRCRVASIKMCLARRRVGAMRRVVSPRFGGGTEGSWPIVPTLAGDRGGVPARDAGMVNVGRGGHVVDDDFEFDPVQPRVVPDRARRSIPVRASQR